jgi:uncharacterized repeat protein (TIGR01451 family)
LDSAVAGRDLAYAIDVLNLGPTAAETVGFTDTLPAGVSFVSMLAPGFTCSGTATVTCSKASMSAGEFAAPTLTVRIASSVAPGTALTNTATVSSATEDPVPANNSSTATNTVVAQADLGVTGPSAATITTTPAGTCTVAGGTVSCTWTSLAVGAVSTATIAVPWRSAVGQVCNNGTVSAGTFDPNAINNSAGACVGKK